MTGGCRRWFSAVPPGKSSGRLKLKVMPASTSRTPWSTFSGVSRLMRPSSSSSPQSPHVDPSGRCTHRFVTGVDCHTWFAEAENVIPNYFVVSGDDHLLEPIDLFKTRLPKHLRDRAVWEEDFEIEPWVEGGATVFRRLHTPGFEGWTV